jgi:hypothetical protein
MSSQNLTLLTTKHFQYTVCAFSTILLTHRVVYLTGTQWLSNSTILGSISNAVKPNQVTEKSIDRT